MTKTVRGEDSTIGGGLIDVGLVENGSDTIGIVGIILPTRIEHVVDVGNASIAIGVDKIRVSVVNASIDHGDENAVSGEVVLLVYLIEFGLDADGIAQGEAVSQRDTQTDNQAEVQ